MSFISMENFIYLNLVAEQLYPIPVNRTRPQLPGLANLDVPVVIFRTLGDIDTYPNILDFKNSVACAKAKGVDVLLGVENGEVTADLAGPCKADHGPFW